MKNECEGGERKKAKRPFLPFYYTQLMLVGRKTFFFPLSLAKHDILIKLNYGENIFNTWMCSCNLGEWERWENEVKKIKKDGSIHLNKPFMKIKLGSRFGAEDITLARNEIELHS